MVRTAGLCARRHRQSKRVTHPPPAPPESGRGGLGRGSTTNEQPAHRRETMTCNPPLLGVAAAMGGTLFCEARVGGWGWLGGRPGRQGDRRKVGRVPEPETLLQMQRGEQTRVSWTTKRSCSRQCRGRSACNRPTLPIHDDDTGRGDLRDDAQGHVRVWCEKNTWVLLAKCDRRTRWSVRAAWGLW
jgi:hypothetical protein